MSVLERNRTISKVEFINTAIELRHDTIHFLTLISARYQRVLSIDEIAKVAAKIVTELEVGNSIFPNSDAAKAQRKAHFQEARGYVNALDVHLSDCYGIMSTNPQGCFTKKNGKTISSTEAVSRLDKYADRLGNLIDKEKDLIDGVMKKTC